jgi:regulator of protease activity HflC (stomatin/prohibitin superfamily)
MNNQRGNATVGLLGGFLLIFAVIYAFIWATFQYSVITENGYESVIVDRPYFWGHEGVRPETQKSGTRSREWNTTIAIPVQMTPQTIPMQFDDLPTSDNILLDFSTSIQVQVTDARKLIQNKGEEWFNNNLRQPWSSSFRDQTKAHTMTEIMTDPKVAAEMEKNLLVELNDRAKKDGISVIITDFNMGRGRPNEDVLSQMNKTAAEQQRAKTMDATDQAEIKRKKAEGSRADADQEYANKMKYTPEQVIQLAAINAYATACESKGASCIIMAPGANPGINVK